MNQNAKDFIRFNTLDLESNNRMDSTGYVQYAVSEAKAYGAIIIAEDGMREKAIECYIENCEYKSDWCCGCAEAHGAILAKSDVCMGKDCPTVKQFIEKLNS